MLNFDLMISITKKSNYKENREKEDDREKREEEEGSFKGVASL